MKESREYSKKVQKLYRTLKRQPARHTGVVFDEPVDSLVYAVVSENMTEAQTQSAIKKLKDYFVDWNDLRVATVDEIAEVLGPVFRSSATAEDGQETAAARNAATALVNSLRAVFEKYNMLSLQALRKLGKRPAKQVLEKLNGTTPFVVDYCMLTALQGHAIPLTPKMIEFLKTNGLAHAEAGYEEIEGFLARQIPMKSAYGFYSLLRHESESPKAQKVKKTKPAKKT
jgi:endonuclease-3